MTLPDAMPERVDLLIVGGGIVGAGIARDAALRGLDTLLIEQHDFAFGTSSRTSRLLHGGIRYLAQGKIRLVHEASREKMTLHRIAPHLAQPLCFTFPAYRGGGWPRWKLAIGVKIYDWLCGERNVGPSKTLSPDRTREQVQGLQPERLNGSVQYFDGFTNDARLVLDNLRSAARHGARLYNYTRFISAEPDDNGWVCRLENGTQHDVRARLVINATGPWSSRIAHSTMQIRPTKGAHLVIERDRLPLETALVMPRERRILFGIPWGERTILGTTDTDFSGDLARVYCDEQDTEYILDVVNRYFPAAELSPEDVISTWAGLRPLVADRRGNPSDISRSHKIQMNQSGWWDVAGGKLTTYRLIAEQTLDQALSEAGLKTAGCRTADEPLLAESDRTDVSGILPPEVTEDVVDHYCSQEWAMHL
ncbi:MAG: glycerol-3-phosphate dehydrogenase/oxidase, partial [Verrucomicrobiota bacterium]